jgi:SWI/SNF related-matrix-associated actin-dependent regulator of chromatin subfamily C
VLGISSGLEVQLAKIVTYMGGELVPRRTEPHTHYVVADPNPTAGADDEYVRTLTRTNEKALVHWWYYPDSYDCWIPQQEVQGEVDEPPTLQYPCTVTDRWLRDSFSFNEWMNELDYEPEESEAEEDAPLPQRKSRTKAIEAMKSTIEREQRPDDAIEETDDLEDDKPSRKKRKEMDDTNTQAGAGDSPQEGDEPDKKKRKPNATPKQGVPNGSAPITTPKIPSTKNITAKTVPRQSAQITPLPANKKPSRNSNRSGNYVNITDAYAGIVQTTPLSIRPVASLVLPAHAQWFDMSTVSDYEKQALAEFFSNNPKTPSKTPEVYKEYRDFMIHAYQQNPSQYLSFTACRRSLSGDALAILKFVYFYNIPSRIMLSLVAN